MALLFWGILLILLPGPQTLWPRIAYPDFRFSYTEIFDVLDRLPQALGFLLLWFSPSKALILRSKLTYVGLFVLAFFSLGQGYVVYCTSEQTLFSIVCLCVMSAGQVWTAASVLRFSSRDKTPRPPLWWTPAAVYAAANAACVSGAILPDGSGSLYPLAIVCRLLLLGFNIWFLYKMHQSIAGAVRSKR